MDLFEYSSQEQIEREAPLAYRMRPQDFDEFAGQGHIVGEGTLLRRSIEADRLTSIILWGPAGTGKTTLAHIIANRTASHFATLSAVLDGIKDLREVIESAKERRVMHNLRTVLFVDEIHRWNKAQQDALLPHVEQGTVILVGATTENPYFEVIRPLLSRSRVFELRPLSDDDLRGVLARALADEKRGLGGYTVEIDDDALEHLIRISDGDARTALNALELAVITTRPGEDGVVHVDLAVAQESIQQRAVHYDKGADEHYDTISAFIKSVRGSDPDAALYWLARMLDGGCDPLYLARRVVRMASEDIGNADPRALTLALNAWDVQERLGSPEGELALAQAVVYMACAPKSNAVYSALQAAMQDARSHGSLDVPLHLRNAPTRLMKELGYGKGYRYAHDEPEAYAAGENYFPDELQGTRYYYPVDRGLEIKIREKLEHLRDLDRRAQRSRK